MRAVIQRVSSASVITGETSLAETGEGLLIFLGIETDDDPDDVEWLSGKIVKMRLFPDESGVMNRSLTDTGGDLVVVSQFTLHASVKKGNRPSYIRAARPEAAVPLYRAFIQKCSEALGKQVFSGEFGADMQVSLVNNGPVTILIDSRNRE